MKPEVSIIIPTYNRASWLDVSVGSVLRQTYSDWECLIVDDRSTDDTAERVAAMSELDPRIRYLRNERKQGPSGARNFGWEHAQGKYIAYLDSDDEWEAFHLETMVSYLERYPDQIDVMTANPARRYRSSGELRRRDELDLSRYRTRLLEGAHVLESEGVFDRVVSGGRLLTTQTIVARRSVLERVSWDDEVRAGEDILFPMEIAAAEFRVAHLQAVHVTYWIHEDNTTNGLGQHSPERMVPVYQGFVRLYERALDKLSLNAAQRRHIEHELAETLVWQLGYRGYLPLGEYRLARKSMWKGLRLRPYEWKYWKTLCGSAAKEWIASIRGLPAVRRDDSGQQAIPAK